MQIDVRYKETDLCLDLVLVPGSVTVRGKYENQPKQLDIEPGTDDMHHLKMLMLHTGHIEPYKAVKAHLGERTMWDTLRDNVTQLRRRPPGELVQLEGESRRIGGHDKQFLLAALPDDLAEAAQ